MFVTVSFKTFTTTTIPSLQSIPEVFSAGVSLAFNSLDKKPTWSLFTLVFSLPWVPLYAAPEPVWLWTALNVGQFLANASLNAFAIFSTEVEPPNLISIWSLAAHGFSQSAFISLFSSLSNNSWKLKALAIDFVVIPSFALMIPWPSLLVVNNTNACINNHSVSVQLSFVVVI